jgi:hypothetical protein
MTTAKPPPNLAIPSSDHTVSVSIIDTTSNVRGIPVEYFMNPLVPGYTHIDAPCYAFLIKHDNSNASSKYDSLVFDLGVRKDWEHGPKATVDQVKGGGFDVTVDKSVSEILTDGGEKLEDVGGIIWSHHHL